MRTLKGFCFIFFIVFMLTAMLFNCTEIKDRPLSLSEVIIDNMRNNPTDWIYKKSESEPIHLFFNKKCNIRIQFKILNDYISDMQFVSPDSLEVTDEFIARRIYNTYTNEVVEQQNALKEKTIIGVIKTCK